MKYATAPGLIRSRHGRVKASDIMSVLDSLEKLMARISVIEALTPFRDKPGSIVLTSFSFPFEQNDENTILNESYNYYRKEINLFHNTNENMYYEIWIHTD